MLFSLLLISDAFIIGTDARIIRVRRALRGDAAQQQINKQHPRRRERNYHSRPEVSVFVGEADAAFPCFAAHRHKSVVHIFDCCFLAVDLRAPAFGPGHRKEYQSGLVQGYLPAEAAAFHLKGRAAFGTAAGADLVIPAGGAVQFGNVGKEEIEERAHKQNDTLQK